MGPRSNPLKASSTNRASCSSWIRHPELYISDGTLVLKCKNTLFRIPGGILALNSEVFQDIMSLEVDRPTDAETCDGCPCIHLADKSEDLEVFLKALFIAGYIPADGRLPSFHIVEGVLRLSTKYRAHGLRDRMIHLLSRGYHTAYDVCLSADLDGEAIFPMAPHPNRVLNLFRECGLMRFLPFAFYRVCTSMGSIFNTESGNQLSREDLRIAAVGFTRLLRARQNVIINLNEPSPDCTNIEGRLMVMSTLPSYILAGDQSDLGIRVLDLAARGGRLHCCNECSSFGNRRRLCCIKEVWFGLPAMFELPEWRKLDNAM